jgi:hypothetical protein
MKSQIKNNKFNGKALNMLKQSETFSIAKFKIYKQILKKVKFLEDDCETILQHVKWLTDNKHEIRYLKTLIINLNNISLSFEL